MREKYPLRGSPCICKSRPRGRTALSLVEISTPWVRFFTLHGHSWLILICLATTLKWYYGERERERERERITVIKHILLPYSCRLFHMARYFYHPYAWRNDAPRIFMDISNPLYGYLAQIFRRLFICYHVTKSILWTLTFSASTSNSS